MKLILVDSALTYAGVGDTVTMKLSKQALAILPYLKDGVEITVDFKITQIDTGSGSEARHSIAVKSQLVVGLEEKHGN
jgi:hypothetical protein